MDAHAIVAESILHSLLYKRIIKYAPQYSQSVKNELEQYDWGKEAICLEKVPDGLEKLFNLIGSEDSEPLPLVSIFSDLQLFKNDSPINTYYNASEWNEPVYFPSSSKPSKKSISFYWEHIAVSYMKWIQCASSDLDVRISQFFDWAERWVSSVPVNNQMQSISLSEFFRVIFAIVVAMRNGDKIKLVVGDVSGIQAYLFDIAHIGAGKVAKRLRARSFALSLIAESAAHHLLLKEKLSIHNLILSAGGLFYAIIPANSSTKEWKQTTNKFLYNRYHGAVTLYTGEKEISITALVKQFSKEIRDIYEQIQKDKANPFAEILLTNETWNTKKFIHNSFGNKSPCDSCRKFPKVNNNDEFCEFCSLDEKIGKTLPKTNYLVFEQGRSEESDNCIPVGPNLYVRLCERQDEVGTRPYFVQIWNKSKHEEIRIPYKRKWVTNYIPLATNEVCKILNEKITDQSDVLVEGQPLTFAHMAQLSKGKKLIGYFKADIDYLGMIFSIGFFRSDNPLSHTIFHTTLLSKMLERFFAGGVNEWLRTRYTFTYTVFSGGDDLFLIGPWSEIIEAAKEIEQYFRSYVGLNKEITLSASISILKANTPIPHAAKIAEEGLENAKETANRFRLTEDGKQKGRNQVAVLTDVMSWDDFKRFTDTAVQVSNWWSQNKLTSSFVYQLVNFSKMYKKYREHGDIPSLKFVPLLSYFIERNLIETNLLKPEKDEIILNWLHRLLDIDQPEVDKIWTYMETIVRLSYFYRKGE
ncbi:type III-A CRISPR-associated protein Cas10/Csm1 [Geobacillus stearothermophilus]|uniref:type III-A CRISPR-associated protein Cas10/Csm1 n=1 Tax=Geobacillus stearothermophilus TaxID=1422 RepID=UPI003D221A44